MCLIFKYEHEQGSQIQEPKMAIMSWEDAQGAKVKIKRGVNFMLLC